MSRGVLKQYIEFQKYQFELKYQKDFRAVIVSNAVLFILMFEILVRSDQFQTKESWMMIGLAFLSMTIVVFTFVYVRKRAKFLNHLSSLFKQYNVA